MYRKVVDVSTYNGTVDWGKAKKNGVEGAIIKIISKSLAKDKQFTNNYKGCNTNKIPWGVYNYSYATTTTKAKSDMTLLCDILDSVDKTYFKLGVWFDIEDSCQAALSKSKIAAIINMAQKTVEARGYAFGVYTGMAYYKAHMDASAINCNNWWIARYYKGYTTMKISTNPNADYIPTVVKNLVAWQYTSSGTIASGTSTGNSGKFDLNIQYRDIEATTTTSTSTSSASTSTDLTVDGTIGAKTVKRLQKVFGTTQDGKISGQYANYKEYWTSISSAVCSWNGGTSAVVKALQKKIGEDPADGILGNNTAKALQKYLIGKGYSCGSFGADGKFGANSAKALQKWLNAQS